MAYPQRIGSRDPTPDRDQFHHRAPLPAPGAKRRAISSSAPIIPGLITMAPIDDGCSLADAGDLARSRWKQKRTAKRSLIACMRGRSRDGRRQGTGGARRTDRRPPQPGPGFHFVQRSGSTSPRADFLVPLDCFVGHGLFDHPELDIRYFVTREAGRLRGPTPTFANAGVRRRVCGIVRGCGSSGRGNDDTRRMVSIHGIGVFRSSRAAKLRRARADDCICTREQAACLRQYAVRLRTTLGVLDTDTRAAEVWALQQIAHCAIPDTPFVVETARGCHRYFHLTGARPTFIHRDGHTMDSATWAVTLSGRVHPSRRSQDGHSARQDIPSPRLVVALGGHSVFSV